jgi:hypothetical protein
MPGNDLDAPFADRALAAKVSTEHNSAPPIPGEAAPLGPIRVRWIAVQPARSGHGWWRIESVDNVATWARGSTVRSNLAVDGSDVDDRDPPRGA